MNIGVDEMDLMLLRMAIWGDKNLNLYSVYPHNQSNVDEEWLTIMDSFSRQALDGLLPDAIALLSKSQQPSMAVKMKMIARQLQVERMNEAMNRELMAFVFELEQQAIPYVLLKGQGVSSLYPNPLHRVCGDIDLYVPKVYLKLAGSLLTNFGALRTSEIRNHINYQAHGVEWELHHRIYYFQKDNRNRLFMEYVDEETSKTPEYVTIGEGRVRVFSPTMNALLLLSHIVNHFYCEGVGLRQLCDYALLLGKKCSEIDSELLLERLEALSLSRAYRVFGFICVHYLGMPNEALVQKPSDSEVQLAHRVMADCLSGGNFGQADSNRRQTLWQKIVFYTRFLRRLWRYRQLCPSEALWWPLAKINRALKGEVRISEEKSALNC